MAEQRKQEARIPEDIKREMEATLNQKFQNRQNVVSEEELEKRRSRARALREKNRSRSLQRRA